MITAVYYRNGVLNRASAVYDINSSFTRIIHQDLELLNENEISFHSDEDFIYVFDRQRFLDVISKNIKFNPVSHELKVAKSKSSEIGGYELHFQELPPQHLYFPKIDDILPVSAVFVHPIKKTAWVVKESFRKEFDLLDVLKGYKNFVDIATLLNREK